MKKVCLIPRILLSFCLGLVSFFAFSLSNDSTQKSKTYAVVIGISTYENQQIPALQFAHRDAESFYNYLQSPAAGEIPADQIIFLSNENAKIAAIYQAFDWLKERATENDKVYIYFAGHGDIETENHKAQGYLLAYNSPPNNYSNNTINIEDLNATANYLSITKKAHVVLITDACHSGKLAGDFFKGKQFVNEQLHLVMNNEVRLTSCQADEEAAEGIHWGKGRGVFSYYLINGLNGFADTEGDGDINLKELNVFLQKSFKEDQTLDRLRHKQTPILDGNPFFLLGQDTLNVFELNTRTQLTDDQPFDLPEGFSNLMQAQPQAVDYFFEIIENLNLESNVPFKDFLGRNEKDFTVAFMSYFIPTEGFENDDRTIEDYKNDFSLDPGERYLHFTNKVFFTLAEQVGKSASVRKKLNQQFIQYCHNKAQELINAYLQGDLKELENRQYYSDKKGYFEFLDMLLVAKNLTSKNDYLSDLLDVNYHYLSGLIARLQLVSVANSDSLMQVAFAEQNKTLELEQFAAYAHNELANLYLYEEKLDYAEHHFKMASLLAPTWAIPWSNMIALYYFTKNYDKALEAINIADSLQPGLAFVQSNAGRVMEETNMLIAENYYLKAIRINKNHFLPYERLGYIFSETGRFQLADRFYSHANFLKEGFTFPPAETVFTMMSPFPTEEIIDSIAPLLCNFNVSNIELVNYVSFVNVMIGEKNSLEKIKQLKVIINSQKDIPLIYHYLAKELYKSGELQEAGQYFNLAISNFETKDELLQRLKAFFTNLDSSPAQQCLLQHFERMTYDILEDHNYLSDIYENLNEHEKTVQQYLEIIKIDSTRYSKNENYEPIGKIRLARYYSRNGEYKNAESVLYQAVSSKKLPSYYSFELKDFYRLMTLKFPRDYIWFEKYGMILYAQDVHVLDALSLIDYNNLDYFSFISPPQTIRINQKMDREKDFKLKGLNSTLTVVNRDIDYPKVSLENLLKSIELSGDISPRVEILEAVATLYMVLEKYTEASKVYEEVFKARNTAEDRTKLINALMLDYELVKATEQLKLLNIESETDNISKIYLAYNCISLKDYSAATRILESLEIEDLAQAEFKLRTEIQLQTQLQKWKRAEDLLNEYKIAFGQNNTLNHEPRAFVLYNLALINAKRKKRKAALKYMQEAERIETSYNYLIENNPSLKKIWENR